eukprot:357281-Chlamydomonas_euryale.AAC.20
MVGSLEPSVERTRQQCSDCQHVLTIVLVGLKLLNFGRSSKEAIAGSNTIVNVCNLSCTSQCAAYPPPPHTHWSTEAALWRHGMQPMYNAHSLQQNEFLLKRYRQKSAVSASGRSSAFGEQHTGASAATAAAGTRCSSPPAWRRQPSVAAVAENDEATTLRFTTFPRLNFSTMSLHVSKGGVRHSSLHAERLCGDNHVCYCCARVFACGQCRAVSDSWRLLRFAAIKLGPRHPERFASIHLVAMCRGARGGPFTAGSHTNTMCNVRILPCCRREELMRRLCSHFASLNRVDDALLADSDNVVAWVQEVFSRAYALQVVACNLKGWTVLGPDAKPVRHSCPGTSVALAKALLHSSGTAPTGKKRAAPGATASDNMAATTPTGKVRKHKTEGSTAKMSKGSPSSFGKALIGKGQSGSIKDRRLATERIPLSAKKAKAH